MGSSAFRLVLDGSLADKLTDRKHFDSFDCEKMILHQRDFFDNQPN